MTGFAIVNERISDPARLQIQPFREIPATMEGAAVDPEGFDSELTLRLLLEITEEQSLAGLVRRLMVRAFEHPPIARAYIWLIDKGDLCAVCARRSECSDQARCLHMIGGARRLGDSGVGPGGVEHLNPAHRPERIPLGVGVTGQVAVSGRQIVLNELDRDPGPLASLDWLSREDIRGFQGVPIMYKGETLGVITLFVRTNVPEQAKAWVHLFGHQLGGAIVNARAFDEIRRLKGQLELQNAYLQEEVVEAKAFGDLVGESPALRHIVNQVDLVAPTEASVLILGESGTGKELVAREIHQRSRRKDKALVRVNCASIPKDLFESEFFGHARGAFTGALKDRAGRFETAEGGTLFLDEIGEVPPDLQGKLLRVLQEKRYERVGEDRTRLADVRIVGATNRDLKKEVSLGRFREDLYYRLNVFPIQVPPLRERLEDIPLLAKHFIELSAKDLRCPPPRLTRAAVTKLQNYHWPGNIRELRNVIERAVILSRGKEVEFDLPTTETRPPQRAALLVASDGDPEILTEAELNRRELQNMLAVLDKTHWKIKGRDGAAELLGVKPTTLLTRLKRMGIKRPGSV